MNTIYFLQAQGQGGGFGGFQFIFLALIYSDHIKKYTGHVLLQGR